MATSSAMPSLEPSVTNRLLILAVALLIAIALLGIALAAVVIVPG